MAPRNAKKSKKRLLTNGQTSQTSRLFDAYIASGLDSLKYSIFQGNCNYESIWHISMKSSCFLDKNLGSKWLQSLDQEEKAHVLKIFYRFVNDFGNSSDFLRRLQPLTIPEIVEEVSKIGKIFGFAPGMNDRLGINFAKRWETSDHFITFETVLKFVFDESLRIAKTLKLKHIRQSQFVEPMLFNFVVMYIRFMVDSVRKIYGCEVKIGRIVRWKSRFANSFLPRWVVPDFVPDEVEASEVEIVEIEECEFLQIVAPYEAQLKKWADEFVGISGRIEVEHFKKNPQNSWFSLILEAESVSDESTSFNLAFPNHHSYELPEPAMNYLLKVHQTSIRNLKTLLRSGEFKTITREILKGCGMKNDLLQNEGLHGLLGELVTVIGKRVLMIEERQVLTDQLESFVRRLTCGRYFLFCEDDADLVDSFDVQFGAQLAQLLEDCVDFERSIVFFKLAIIRYVTRLAVHIVRNVVDIDFINGELKSFVYGGKFEFEQAAKWSKTTNTPQLAPILINLEEEGYSDGFEDMPVRVAPNRLKWIHVKKPMTTSSSQLLEVSNDNHSEEGELMTQVGPNRWKWMKPGPVSMSYSRKMLKKAEEEKNFPKEYLEFMRKIVAENEELKKLCKL